jgi:hypothetical protein
MMTKEQRLAAIANFFSLPSDRVVTRAGYDDPYVRQFDVFVESPTGYAFRLGYFDSNGFFRENPVQRALHRYGVHVREGGVEVGKDSRSNYYPETVGAEPQYDQYYQFDDDGRVVYMSDNRIQQEAES